MDASIAAAGDCVAAAVVERRSFVALSQVTSARERTLALSFRFWRFKKLQKAGLIDYRDLEFQGLVEFRSCLFAGDSRKDDCAGRVSCGFLGRSAWCCRPAIHP